MDYQTRRCLILDAVAAEVRASGNAELQALLAAAESAASPAERIKAAAALALALKKPVTATAPALTPAAFPLLTAMLEAQDAGKKRQVGRDGTPWPTRAERLAETLQKLSAAVAAGGIRAVDLKDIKDGLNRRLEELWDSAMSPFRGYENAQKLMMPVPDAVPYSVSLHTLRGAEKKMAKLRDHPAVAAARAVLAEFGPAADAVESLKDKIVKREVASAEEKAQMAAIPKTKRSELVHAAVKEAFERMRPKMVENYESTPRRVFAGLIADFGPSLEAFANGSKWVPKYRRDEQRTPERDAAIAEAEKFNARYAGFAKYVARYVGKPGGEPLKLDEAALRADANKFVDDAFLALVAKIMEKAGEMEEPAVTDLDVNGLEFTLRGQVKGERVAIRQTIIVNYSSLGNPYYQFPARIYRNGQFQSEAQYKTWMTAA